MCTSANYRLRSRAQFPEHLIDVKKVIACVREHGPEYGAGPKTLILSGTSSGGKLAALGALTAGDLNLQPRFERAGTSVSALVYLSGFYGSQVPLGRSRGHHRLATPLRPRHFLSYTATSTPSWPWSRPAYSWPT